MKYLLGLGFGRRRANDTKALDVGTKLKLRINFNFNIPDDVIKKVLASCWLAINLGNFGARSRRGFGSLECKSIDASERILEIIQPRTQRTTGSKDLLNFIPPTPVTENSFKSWLKSGITTSIQFVTEKRSNKHETRQFLKVYWCDRPIKWNETHNVLNNRASLCNTHRSKILSSVQKKRLLGTFNTYQVALNYIGWTMMVYRTHLNPEYGDLGKDAALTKENIIPINVERYIFGLPIQFFFGKNKAIKRYEPYLYELPGDGEKKDDRDTSKLERFPSPLIIKVASLGKSQFGIIISEIQSEIDKINKLIQNRKISINIVRKRRVRKNNEKPTWETEKIIPNITLRPTNLIEDYVENYLKLTRLY